VNEGGGRIIISSFFKGTTPKVDRLEWILLISLE